MAISKCGLNLNNDYKELIPHGSIEFPIAAYASSHTNSLEDIIPWHYHEEFEIILIIDGSMTLKTPSKTYQINKDEMLILNTNVLHYLEAKSNAKLHSLVFSKRLISGDNSSIFNTKYLEPLATCDTFSSIKITNTKIINDFNIAFNSIEKETKGYEFIVRNKLSNIIFYLYEIYEDKLHIESTLNRDDLRIREMLDFIHENYQNNINLKEIANSALISERECLRCFKKTLQISPKQYLLKYRITKASELLSKDNDLNITEIARNVGFDSPSNFAKTFKLFYKQSPKEYRFNKKI